MLMYYLHHMGLASVDGILTRYGLEEVSYLKQFITLTKYRELHLRCAQKYIWLCVHNKL